MNTQLAGLGAIALSLLFSAANAAANDYTAVRIEAENFSSRNTDWHVTSADNIPQDAVDPFHANASGNSYMELLPDTRVTHDDPLLQGQNFWGGPAEGPALHYNVTVPQPGRYLVFAKAYSTGTEDNGIHVGINSTTPQSGHRMQWCEGKQNWTWSSAQRTDAAHCGVPKTIYLDIASAGEHTITFWAREDGFELDQFILLSETHDGSLDCYPTSSDNIRCDDITTGAMVSESFLPVTVLDQGNGIDLPEHADGIVDLALSLRTADASIVQGQASTFTVDVANQDVAETATTVITQITLPDSLQFSSSETCVSTAPTVTCEFAEIPAGESATASFSATATAPGSLTLTASINADQQDNTVANNGASLVTTASSPSIQIDGSVELISNANIATSGGQIDASATIANLGAQPLSGAQLRIALPAGSAVESDDSSCSGDTTECALDIDTIATGESLQMDFRIRVETTDGMPLVWPVQLTVADDELPTNNFAQLTVDTLAVADTSIDLAGLVSIEAEYAAALSPSSASPAAGFLRPAWNLATSNRLPDVEPDGDNHSAESASANAYLELLPDSRPNNSDPAVSGVSNFVTGGVGPAIDYPVIFSRAGRYYLHARVRATNAQDASIHVGLNNSWPSSASTLTVCAPNDQWQWATMADGCTDNLPAYLDIPTAGTHTVQVSAATDGTEFDKLLLTTSSAFSADGIGPEPTLRATTATDTAIDAELSSSNVMIDESTTLTITVRNFGDAYSASGLSVDIDGIDPALAPQIVGFDDCTATTTGANCTLSSLAAAQTVQATLAINAASAGDTRIAIALSSLSGDTDISNNSAALALQVNEPSGGGSLAPLTLLLLAAAGRRRSPLQRQAV